MKGAPIVSMSLPLREVPGLQNSQQRLPTIVVVMAYEGPVPMATPMTAPTTAIRCRGHMQSARRRLLQQVSR